MCNVQRVMDCFFTWRATIATICNDERLEQTGIDSVALSGRARPIPSGQFHGQEQPTGSGRQATNLKPIT
jgi:hypothetical protein